MRELSVFVDESGGQQGHSKYYLLTLVLHDQEDSLDEKIHAYESALAMRNLPDIPFHASPLMNGHEEYENIDISIRKSLLVSFGVLVQRLPISYKTFAYKRSEVDSEDKLTTRMKRDISTFLFDNLASFQAYDAVKVYYDNGQEIVRQALHDSIEFALSKNVVLFRRTQFADYRLAQVADYLCAVELTSIKFEAGEQTSTDDKFFGGIGSFKKNYLKQARRKLIS